jgi:WD40 repeat protein
MNLGPDGKVVLAGGSDGSVSFWDAVAEQPLVRLPKGHTDAINSVAISPDGKLGATGSSDRTVALWDLGQRLRTAVLGGAHKGSVLAVGFSPNGKLLATGGNDGRVAVWEVAKRQLLGGISSPILKTRQQVITSLAFSPNGQLLATTGDDGSIVLWKMDTLQPACAPLQGPTDPLTSVAFYDDKHLVTSDEKGRVLLWNVQKYPVGPPDPLYRHTSAVNSISFSHDGTLLALGGADGKVVVYDFAERRLLGAPTPGNLTKITSLAFGLEKTLYFADEQVLWRWNLDEAAAETSACQRAGANLSLDEWRLYFSEQTYCRICTVWSPGLGAPAGAPLCPRGTL